jgi:hypothetical protein
MTSAKSQAKQKVAIVGSGMAGLATAHLLRNDLNQRFAVTVFESVRMSWMLLFAADKVPLERLLLTRFCVHINTK